MAEPAFHSPAQAAVSPHSTFAAMEPQSREAPPHAPAVQISRHDYNFSPRAQDESSATEDHGGYTDGEVNLVKGETASSRSSISSLPASVTPIAVNLGVDTVTPTNNSKFHDLRGSSQSNGSTGRKWRDSPFRNPSSVRSIQMRDEDDDILYQRKRTSRTPRNMSTYSARSSESISQAKRRTGRESLLSPKSSKVKKEFPLVLLHCSLLPPVLPIKARISDVALLQAVLPEEYWRCWELLNDKITGDLEIQSRGVLIPHPKSDYELLEERLLESLELTKPKLRSGHYYGNENVDVDESESDADTAYQGTKCQDCGKKVVEDIAQDRKWEVKVYAANGLMRAGAWSAAWNEMEKVDVEVSMCLPEDVRRDVEERCLHLGIGHDIEEEEVREFEVNDAETRRREIYGTPENNAPQKVDDYFGPSHPYNDGRGGSFAEPDPYQNHHRAPALELKQLAINYVKRLAQDRRNVLIAFLSLAVLFFALNTSAAIPQGDQGDVVPTSGSVQPSQTIPQCTMSPVSSAGHSSLAQPASTTLKREEPVTSRVCEDPNTSKMDADPVTPTLCEDSAASKTHPDPVTSIVCKDTVRSKEYEDPITSNSTDATDLQASLSEKQEVGSEIDAAAKQGVPDVP